MVGAAADAAVKILDFFLFCLITTKHLINYILKNLIWLKYFTISENTSIFNIYNVNSIILPKRSS